MRCEQAPDLLGHDVEQPCGRLGGGSDRDPAECGLLPRQGGKLLASLCVRQRDGDEVRELLEASLDVGWESLGAVDRDRGGAPEPPGDHDRRRHC
jgi:hypothetical protein